MRWLASLSLLALERLSRKPNTIPAVLAKRPRLNVSNWGAFGDNAVGWLRRAEQVYGVELETRKEDYRLIVQSFPQGPQDPAGAYFVVAPMEDPEKWVVFLAYAPGSTNPTTITKGGGLYVYKALAEEAFRRGAREVRSASGGYGSTGPHAQRVWQGLVDRGYARVGELPDGTAYFYVTEPFPVDR